MAREASPPMHRRWNPTPPMLAAACALVAVSCHQSKHAVTEVDVEPVPKTPASSAAPTTGTEPRLLALVGPRSQLRQAPSVDAPLLPALDGVQVVAYARPPDDDGPWLALRAHGEPSPCGYPPAALDGLAYARHDDLHPTLSSRHSEPSDRGYLDLNDGLAVTVRDPHARRLRHVVEVVAQIPRGEQVTFTVTMVVAPSSLDRAIVVQDNLTPLDPIAPPLDETPLLPQLDAPQLMLALGPKATAHFEPAPPSLRRYRATGYRFTAPCVDLAGPDLWAPPPP